MDHEKISSIFAYGIAGTTTCTTQYICITQSHQVLKNPHSEPNLNVYHDQLFGISHKRTTILLGSIPLAEIPRAFI